MGTLFSWATNLLIFNPTISSELFISSIIGTGLFANGGHILKYAGSPGMAMIVWTFGSLVAFAGGLSYAEWGLMIPESGGDLPYLEFIYRKPRQFASFLFCFCRVILIHTGETAALWYGICKAISL